ncbi:MAG: hypothetical protein WC997_02265 [Porticoccaceae bacterium]
METLKMLVIHDLSGSRFSATRGIITNFDSENVEAFARDGQHVIVAVHDELLDFANKMEIIVEERNETV